MSCKLEQSKTQCVVSINDETFETWVQLQDTLTEESRTDLLRMYTEWRQLNTKYKELEYDYLSENTHDKKIDNQKSCKKRQKTNK